MKKPRKEPTTIVTLRLSPMLRGKLALLGGPGWIRDRINRAHVPEPVAEQRIENSPAIKPAREEI